MTAANYVLRALDKFASFGDADAIVHRGQRASYTEVRNATLGLAAALREQGIQPGAGVAMLTPNSLRTPSLQLALHLLGCRTLWIAAYEPPRIQAEFFQAARAQALIYTPGSARRDELVADVTSRDPSLLVLKLGEGDGPGANLLAALPDQPPPFDPGQAGPDPVSLFYSGGTTGRSKLVEHGQHFYETLLDIADYYLSIDEPAMRFLTTAGFTHTSGQMPAFLTLFEGGTLFQGLSYAPDGFPAAFLAAVERERIDSTFLTPALLYMILDSPVLGTTDTSSLRYLNVGGAAASPARLAQAIERFGPVVRIVYGSSEVPLITDYPFLDHDPDYPDRLSSCGLPFLDTEIEIRDEDGRLVPVGEAGEVWVSGNLLMSGYWQRPDLTAETVVDKWLRTGDVGYLDQDGYLFLVDRLTDMIVSFLAATNIYARPIEDALTSHAGVSMAAVIGVPDEAFGEAVRAYVVRTADSDVTADELRELVRVELEDGYVPRDVEFVAELPMTSLFKVDKKELRRRASGGS